MPLPASVGRPRLRARSLPEPTGTIPIARASAAVEDPVDDLLDRAVATDRHEPIAAVGRGPRRELLRLAASARHVEIGIGTRRQPLADPRQQLARRDPTPRSG